jgi:8-oxo-dGTP pyrophosphatase MutT (NUDIX family)
MIAKRVSGAVLVTKDKKVVLRRLPAGDMANPKLLDVFGGPIEKDELPLQALMRQLGEETSLEIRQVPEKIIEQHWYQLYIRDAGFKVHEGVGAEEFTIKQALARKDLTYAARQALERLSQAQA